MSLHTVKFFILHLLFINIYQISLEDISNILINWNTSHIFMKPFDLVLYKITANQSFFVLYCIVYKLHVSHNFLFIYKTYLAHNFVKYFVLICSICFINVKKTKSHLISKSKISSGFRSEKSLVGLKIYLVSAYINKKTDKKNGKKRN